MKIKLLFLILGLSLFSAKAQQTARSQKYLNDFDYFIENLIATHPDPFSAFDGEMGFYKAKYALREKVKNVSTDEEFITLLNRFISKLNDGHTYINRPLKSQDTKAKFLPLRLKPASDRLFIQNTTDTYKFLQGKALVAIEHIPVDSLLHKVKFYFSSENRSGDYFGLMYLINNNLGTRALLGKSRDQILLTVEDQAGQKRWVEVTYGDRVTWPSQPSKLLLPEDNSWINRAMIGKNKDIGYFQWNSILSREILEKVYRKDPRQIERNLEWFFRNSSVNKRTGNIQKDMAQVPSLYKEFYRLLEAMHQKGAKYLILDLRRNSGGMTPLLQPLLYMLYGEKYLNFNFGATYTVKISPLFLKKYGVTLDQYNKMLHTDFTLGDYYTTAFGNVPGTTLAEKETLAEKGYGGFGSEYVIKSKSLGLHPRIIILTSVHTFSAAYHLTYFLKKLGNATLIGVAPRQAGNTFMENTSIELPNTKITGSISNSIQILFENEPKNGKLLHPDLEMSYRDFSRYHFDKNAEVLEALDFIQHRAPF